MLVTDKSFEMFIEQIEKDPIDCFKCFSSIGFLAADNQYH